jgi:hypothetical protein
MDNVETFINGLSVVSNVLAVLMGLAAIAVSILKKGSNAQAIRAVAVVAIFTFGFMTGLAAVAWAVLDFVVPNTGIKITAKKKK